MFLDLIRELLTLPQLYLTPSVKTIKISKKKTKQKNSKDQLAEDKNKNALVLSNIF